jgi:hypothetical protein
MTANLKFGVLPIEIIRRIVNEADPESLLKMECPADEYESEIHCIHEKLECSRPRSPIDCANIVALVWFWFFGDPTKPLQFHPCAFEIGRNIWNSLQEHAAIEQEKQILTGDGTL